MNEINLQQGLEREVLGCLLTRLNNKGAIIEALERIEPKDFESERHRIIYSCLVDCFVKNNVVDLVSLSNELQHRNQLAKVGGAIYLTELQDTVTSAEGVQYRLAALMERSQLRQLKETCLHTVDKIQKHDFGDTTEVFDEHEERVYLLQNVSGPGVVDIVQVANSLIDRAKNIEKTGVFGYSWGIPKLDYLTSGIELAKSYVLGGIKKSGKSKFVINTIHALKKQNITTLFLSLEMNPDSVVLELLSRFGGVENIILKRKLKAHDEQVLRNTIEKIQSDIIVDPTPGLTVSQVRSKIWKATKQGAKVVFLDYLQRMSIRTEMGSNYATAVSKAVAQLADIAKEYNVALIFLCQLANRAEGEQADISHLKDSGGIAEGVDCILILNNQDRIKRNYYEKTNEVWFTVEQRSGMGGIAKCFVDLSKAAYHEKYDPEDRKRMNGRDSTPQSTDHVFEDKNHGENNS